MVEELLDEGMMARPYTPKMNYASTGSGVLDAELAIRSCLTKNLMLNGICEISSFVRRGYVQTSRALNSGEIPGWQDTSGNWHSHPVIIIMDCYYRYQKECLQRVAIEDKLNPDDLREVAEIWSTQRASPPPRKAFKRSD